MNIKFEKEFQKIMKNDWTIALATCVDNEPNVRVVNFYYNPDNNTLYFASFDGCEKNKEIEKNNKISFTTISVDSKNFLKHARCKGAVTTKSKLSIFDLKDAFINKFPFYKETIESCGDKLIVYEIKLKSVKVIVGMKDEEERELTF